MIAEVIRKEQKSSNSDAERAIKRWFKEATDRKGGRKLRAEKKETKTSFCLTSFLLVLCFNGVLGFVLLFLYS